MTQIIEFTATDGKPVLINLNHVTEIVGTKNGFTSITYQNDEYGRVVQQPYEEVRKMIEMYISRTGTNLITLHKEK